MIQRALQIFLIGLLATSANAQVRVLSSTTPFTDSQGYIWSPIGTACTTYLVNGGTGGIFTTTSPIANALPSSADQTLYQGEIFQVDTCTFNVPTGTYDVTGKFAEIASPPNTTRNFSVTVNGATWLTNFSPYVAAGNTALKAVDKTIQVNVDSSGSVVFKFLHGSGCTPTACSGNAIVEALSILPSIVLPTLSSLTLNPASLTGGMVSDGVVSLTSAAPQGNMTVALTTDTSGVTVPNNITIGTGNTSAHFGVGTLPVTAVQTATIGAALSGVVKTAPLTISPAPPPSPPVMTVISATVTLAAIPAPPVTTHTVALTWTPAAPPPNGFAISSCNIGRALITGGPYTKIGNVPSPGVSYIDSTVTSGATYFYVVQVVDSAGQLSAYSNEASAVIP